MGTAIDEFEHQLAKYVGVKHAITCGSGTDALQLIYMAYGIGEGDAVFCPDMTFIASVEPACLLGATPVLCEIDSNTYNIDASSLERQIKRVLEEGNLKPRAVVAVDFLGRPAEYDEIRKITNKYEILLIEDAAQGIGAFYGQSACGSLGDIGATSFFPSKPLGAYGDGGAVFTNNDTIADRIRSMRVHGKGTSKYENICIGINSRLDTIQAQILLVKLKYLEEEILRRQTIAKIYDCKLQSLVKVPPYNATGRSAYAQYVVLLKETVNREHFRNYLAQHNIPSIVYYPNPLHRLPVFHNINTYGESYAITEQYSETNVGLPFSPYLTNEEQDKVISTIKDYDFLYGGH